ncbi:guanine nucleotide exchange factor [Pichia kluyveri]|uniref:Guanine nucleotide exchange factor n=1 Tax=Pichia kluyveri TaxID=36015 RepID=A0AAV5QYC6_PICKL|nr:guanine nucleotide exchange factor [Pichia kluyveri]
MGKINQPNSQIRLTNVSLVRMKKGKKRFEIACYQNKVHDFQSGVEKNIDEVLQIPQIFLNVSKGQIASSEDLKASFNTTNIDEIILEILKKGEIQLSEKERAQQNEKLHKEILNIISAKCINPKSKKRYPPTMIDKALKELKFNFVNARSAKSKSLEAIKLLVEKQIIPIARAKLRVKVILNTETFNKVKSEFENEFISFLENSEIVDDNTQILFLLEPENYKPLGEKVKSMKGKLELVDSAVIQEGEIKL